MAAPGEPNRMIQNSCPSGTPLIVLAQANRILLSELLALQAPGVNELERAALAVQPPQTVADVQATLLELTARSVTDAIRGREVVSRTSVAAASILPT